jgi:hypothetical protein
MTHACDTWLLTLCAGLALGGCGKADHPERVGPPSGIAVIQSDYGLAMSLSLLDREGTLACEDCVNSGTRAPRLSQALSGDIALPSMPQPANEVLLIDRGSDVLTWLDPTRCAPRAQLAVGTAFKANPHDVVAISPTKAYVTRYAPNGDPTPAPDDFDEGDDILIIDPSVPAIIGRIDLSAFTLVSGDTVIWPHPDRALLVNDRVYLSLNGLSDDYLTAAPGRILVLDPQVDGPVGVIEIPQRTCCGAMSYVDASHTLLVACSGLFDGDGHAIGNGAGLAAIDIGVSPPVITANLDGASFRGRPVSGSALGAMSLDRVFVVTNGDSSGSSPDAFWAVSLTSGEPTLLFEASGAFVFASVLADPDNERVLLADGTSTQPLLRVLEASDAAAIIELPSFDPGPTLGLPPRGLAWY